MKKFGMFIIVCFIFALVAGNTVMGQVVQTGDWDAAPFATLNGKHAREAQMVASKETIKQMLTNGTHTCYVPGQGLWSLDPRAVPRIYARAQKIFDTEREAGFFWSGPFEMGRFIDSLVDAPVLDGEFWEAINTEKKTATYIFGSGSRKAYKFETKLQTRRGNEFLGQVCINLSTDPVVAVVGCEPCKAPEPKQEEMKAVKPDSTPAKVRVDETMTAVKHGKKKPDEPMTPTNPDVKKGNWWIIPLVGIVATAETIGVVKLLDKKSKPAPPADPPNLGGPGSGGNNGGGPGSGGRFAKLLTKVCEKIQALQQ